MKANHRTITAIATAAVGVLCLCLLIILVVASSADVADVADQAAPTAVAQQTATSPAQSPTAVIEPTNAPTETPTQTPTETATPLPTNTPLPTDTPTPRPTSTPRPTNTPTATPTPTPAPILANGSGDGLVDVTTGGAPSIVRITHSGSSNFVVRSYDANNAPINLMVNVIGAYEGVLPLDLLDREQTTRLQIQARGAWTVEILPLAEARRIQAPDTVIGRGDDVLIVLGDSDTAAITHSGSSNFVVYGYSQSGRQLMVNEIGAYQGVKILPARFFLFTIKADGEWEIAVTVR